MEGKMVIDYKVIYMEIQQRICAGTATGKQRKMYEKLKEWRRRGIAYRASE
jgi:hypothetical protein